VDRALAEEDERSLKKHPRSASKLRRGMGQERRALSIRLRLPGLGLSYHSKEVTGGG
jgi:hypothetical protein